MAPAGVCPNCGQALKRNASFCPECGSDEKTGWKSSEEVDYQSVSLPEEGEYEEFLEREGLGPRRSVRKKNWVLIAGILLALALVLSLVLV